ncbi:MAG: fluoride efflux transporter CrcB [Pseudomonadales bacterium]|nr:fluoride efflux transporter CrcB [Pseudomonadales bacterium]
MGSLINNLFWVGLGGALGAASRFLIHRLVSLWFGVSFPWGTLGINIVGCFAIGCMIGACNQTAWFETYGRAFLVIGFLGAFTTFSTFSLETINLFEQSRIFGAIMYAGGTTVACLCVAWLGMRIGNTLA